MKPIICLLLCLGSQLLLAVPSYQPVTGARVQAAVSKFIAPGFYEGERCSVEVVISKDYYFLGLSIDQGRSVYISTNLRSSSTNLLMDSSNPNQLDICNRYLFEVSTDGSHELTDIISIEKVHCNTKLNFVGTQLSKVRNDDRINVDNWQISCEIDPNSPTAQ